jgi:hypothetical protein
VQGERQSGFGHGFSPTLSTLRIGAALLGAHSCFPKNSGHLLRVKEGQPLTAVVITQCNLVVAVYFTMQVGKLNRFDKNAGSSIKAEDLVTLAYNSAKRSERVEVGCDRLGLQATEPHGRTDL